MLFMQIIHAANPLLKAFLRGIIFLTFSLLLTYILQYPLKVDGPVFHTIVNLIRIGIAFFIFLNTWVTYDEGLEANNIIGFGFFIVSAFAISHTYLYPGIELSNSAKITILLSNLTEFTQAFIIYLALTWPVKRKLNKYKVLLFVVGISFITLGFIWISRVSFAKYSPLILTSLQYLNLTFLILALYKLRNRLDDKYYIAYEYVFTALLLATVAQLLSLFFPLSRNGFVLIFSHIIKTLNYYYLFRGIYISSVSQPFRIMNNVLNQMPVGLFLYNGNGKISFLNKPAQELTGIFSSEILSFVIEQLKDQSEISNQLILGENTQRKINVLMDALKLNDGSYLLMLRDAKKEQELENLQLQTKTLLRAMNNPALITDAQDKIIQFNDAFLKITGLTTNDVYGQYRKVINKLIQFKWESEITPDSKVEKGNDLSAKGNIASLVTPDGTKKYIIVNRNVIQNVEGEILGRVIVGSEITDLREQEEKLRQQEKLVVLGEMAAGIVHEIRNPLTTLKGFSQIISHKAKDEQIQEYAKIMVDTADEVNKVVSDFLTFAKPSKPVLNPFDPNTLLQSVLSTLDSHAFMQGVSLKVTPCLIEQQLLGDISQLKSVFLNIALNGIQSMSDVANPLLKISCEHNEHSGEILFKITDNGKGIPPEDIQKLGTPFYSTKDKGTGLGLSICYQIIRKHNGRIDIDSSLGVGSTFIIALPSLTEEPDSPYQSISTSA